jgi:hypothetical protein
MSPAVIAWPYNVPVRAAITRTFWYSASTRLPAWSTATAQARLSVELIAGMPLPVPSATPATVLSQSLCWFTFRTVLYAAT